jgi:uncharacterized membrane protein YphA (DoxX/SURF4 family)
LDNEMNREKTVSVLLGISRIVVGLVFIFSGFVKGVDPMGSAYKFSDYFNAFNMGFLDPLSPVLSFIMCAVEFLIGISLVFSFRLRLGAWVVAVFMVLFTVLTLILALTNPVTDCGCFGDAIIMTNWQTFFKNLVLLPFVFVVFYFRGTRTEPWPSYFSWAGITVFAVLFLALETHAYRHLPQLDFRPYSVGTYIPDKMSVPEGAPRDEYQTFLYYEKGGEVREFTEDNFPWDDSTWTFVDSKHILISKGKEPPIHDFTIVDERGADRAGHILADEGYSFLLVSTHIEKGDPQALSYAGELATWCLAMGHSFYCTSSSVEEEILRTKAELDLSFPVHASDEITLKTIIRSNPGLLLLKNGTILAKWHYNDFPPIGELQENLLSFALTGHRQNLENRNLTVFICIFLVLTVFIVYSPYGKNKL